jgi:hypothetical protein
VTPNSSDDIHRVIPAQQPSERDPGAGENHPSAGEHPFDCAGLGAAAQAASWIELSPGAATAARNGEYMSNRKSSESTFMNRRTLLSGAAVVGGALAGKAIERPSALGAKTSDTAKPGDSPNLNPPVVQVTSGKLRGIRDGKTSTFLGIPTPKRSGSKCRSRRSPGTASGARMRGAPCRPFR